MFKLRKRIFLFLTLIATVFCVVGCGNKNTVRIYFEKNEYEVRMQTHYELKPVVKASATVNTAELELVYESSNEEIARYVDGTIYPVSEGTVEVKVYWKDKASVYDKAVVKVIKAALPEFRADDPIVVLKGDKKVIPYELHLNYTNAVAKFYALDLSPEVATITEDGVLDPIALGEGTIKVVVSDYSGEEYETKVAIKVIESDFNITYELDGGTNAESNLPAYSALDLPIKLAPATKFGYTFLGWKLVQGETAKIVNEIPAGTYGDITLIAQWELTNYKLNYEFNGEPFVTENPETYTIEDLPLVLKAAEKDGYTFAGWYNGDVKVEQITTENVGDMNLVAKLDAIDYKVTYELNGGTNAESNPATYNADQLPLTLAAPTKEHYVFAGWKLGEEVVETIPAGKLGDVTLVATWTVKEYTITYELDGGTNAESNPATYNVEQLPLALAAPTKAGYKFLGWFNGETKVEQLTVENIADVTLTAKWEIETYTITYNLDGGTLTGETTTYTVLDEVELVAPTKENHVFLGWLLNGEVLEKVAKGTTGNLELVASWKEQIYKLTLDVNGGALVGVYATREEMVNDFMKDFGKFAGIEMTTVAQYWAADPQRTTFWQNAEMHAKWSWIFKALIPFAKAQGEDTKYLQNMLVDPISISGYATQNVAIYLLGINSAMWNETYKATYNGLPSRFTTVDCTSDEVKNSWMEYCGAPTTVSPTEEVVLPLAERKGYTFLGWFNGEEKVEKIEKGTTADITLVAKWEVITYSITYNTDGGTLTGVYATREEMVNDFMKDFGKFAGIEMTTVAQYWAADPQRTTFWQNAEMHAKWSWIFKALIPFAKAQGEDTKYLQNMLVDPISISGYATQNVAIYLLGINSAMWNETYKATYNGLPSRFTTVDCTSDEVKNSWMAHCGLNTTYTVEDEVKLPSVVKDKATFIGWFVGEEKVEKIEKGTIGNLELVAKFDAPKYKIAYNLDGGTLPEGAATEYVFGKGLTELPVPTKVGFTFLGWFIGEEKVESISATQEGEVELTAKWQENPSHTITFDPAEGVMPAEYPSKFYEGVGLAELPVPTREGYTFVGWFIGEEKVESIAADTTTDIDLVAKWEEKVVQSEYSITYDLNGGAWPVTKITSYEEMAQAFMNAYVEYITNDYSGTKYTGEALPASEFMNISFKYGNLDDFFDNAKYAEWAWVRTFVVEYCAKVDDQYKTNIADKNGEYHNTILRGNVHGFINQSKWDSWPRSADYSTVQFADFEAKLPAGKTIEGPAKYLSGTEAVLVTPVKEGFDFAGWYSGAELVTAITAKMTGDLHLVAKWRAASGEENVIFVGAERTYKTLAEALAVAKAGDTIKVDAGTYEGAEITVSGIIIAGANAGVNPVNSDRSAETVFTTDLVVKADDVTIDGIQIIGAARIAALDQAIENLTIVNVHIFESSVNATNVSTNAPLYFYSTVEGVEYKNVVIKNVLNTNTKEARPMILYGALFNGLTIKDSKFVGARKNYNDGIKIVDSAAFGLKGDVEIVGNHFENYSQYVVWLKGYCEGNYSIQNNVFVNNGQTSGSHAAVTIASYKGAAEGKVVFDFLYNTVRNSYMAVRIDKVDSRTAENFVAHINYNKVYECKATYYVKNSMTFTIDATNNYYDKTPVAAMFLNATWEPYYKDESKVPLYGQPLTFKSISYELDGGELDSTAPTSFDSVTGLSVLPTPTKENRIFVGWLMNGEFVTSIPAGTDTAVTLTAVWREDAIYVSKNGESYAVATIAEALAKAKAGDKIIILAGEYEENVKISVANLTIVGPNEGINPNTATRKAEAIIKGVISFDKDATNLTIDGLAFTGSAKVKNANNGDTISGLTFQNNVAYDMAQTTAWILNRYVSNAFLEIKVSSGASKNIQVFNNKFTNVGDINVLINRVENLTVDGNVFMNFGSDAVRLEGGYCYGILSFTNNHFEQETAGNGNNAIFGYSLAGAGGSSTKVIVKANTFKQVGSSDTETSPYNNALSAHVFQENLTAWLVEENIFDHCVNPMWLRNNGASASNWSCVVKNNQFLGVPTDHYFGTYRGDDNEKTNPHLAVFEGNYYEDNDGNVITDLTAYATMFKHLSTYGTALAEKPTMGASEKYEFWKISYDLDGGNAKGLVYYYNKDTGAITLPVPTWNIYHEFKGWSLNGTIITEIPAGSKGDLHIVATWEELEGNPVTLEFELNGGNWNYASFDEISLDLIKDYNAWGGTNYTQATVPSSAWTEVNIPNFFYSEGMSEKWGWLAKWLSEVGGNPNKRACAALLEYADVDTYKAANSNWTHAASYEFRAFMKGGTAYENGNYKSSDYSDQVLREQVWTPYLETVKATLDTTEGKVLTLPAPKKPFLTFVGWYDNAEFTGEAITTITVGATNPKYYAKFVDLNPVTNVNIKNAITETKRFSTLQLEWEVLPAEAANKAVKFITSDEKVATISSEGLISFLTVGTVTIKVVSLANDRVFGEMTVNVYVPEHINGEYATSSYVVVNETIALNASIVNGTGEIEWSSLNPDIATVENGIVTGVKAGTATIVASKVGNPDIKLEFVVIVLAADETGVVKFVMEQNNANIFLRSQLGIGAGGYAYYADILSSVSKLLFEAYEINKKYYTETPTKSNHSGVRQGALEFITVHYTGNMAAGSTASANANYFVNQSNDSSIHYVTGNDGIFYCYDEKYVTWHAGDGTGTPFEWYPTGVMVKEGDPTRPVVTITENSKFAINGTESTVACPSGKRRYWDATLGKVVEGETIVPTDSKYLTDLGPAVKVVDGQYYIGRTWWCNSQVIEGRVCSLGGNLNSIGIETACNEGSDLWYTWQKTAKLVSDLMIRHELDIERVKGHNFFSAKDCPQPMLENEDEIWWEFIELVKAENTAMTSYKDWTFTMVSNNPTLVDNTGRVIAQPEFDTCVTYTVTATNGEETKTITLASMIPGMYRNLARGER